MIRGLFLILLLGISSLSFAKSITLGKTYDIIEVDGISWFEEKAALWQTPEKEAELQQEFVKTTEKYLENPKGVDLPEVKEERSWKIDLTVKVEAPILDANGKEIYPIGHTVNPLQYLNSGKVLLFIDGDKEAHWLKAIQMAETHPGALKVILTQGKFKDNVKKYSKLRIYFDQHGILTNYFKIRAVPAIVAQEKDMLMVTEVKL